QGFLILDFVLGGGRAYAQAFQKMPGRMGQEPDQLIEAQTFGRHRHGGISRIASIQFTQPLFGIALAAIVLGERPAATTAIAAVGILAGAALVLRAGSR
ncbi:MAG: EamA family transporter, partial [Actinomycetota bacterium]|nr:EamA family transporter [Actinomycetota bacterium]